MITKSAQWSAIIKQLLNLKNFMTAANMAGKARWLTAAKRMGTAGVMGMPFATGMINRAVGYDPREALEPVELPQFGGRNPIYDTYQRWG
jgi:hypothetical protein